MSDQPRPAKRPAQPSLHRVTSSPENHPGSVAKRARSKPRKPPARPDSPSSPPARSSAPPAARPAPSRPTDSRTPGPRPFAGRSPAPRFEPGSRVQPPPFVLRRALRIVHEDDAVIVVDKPAGLLTAAPRESREQSVLHALMLRSRSAAGKPNSKSRTAKLWVVHRLDREASGLLVFAKTESAFNWLKEDFRARRVHRLYLAVTEGRLADTGQAGSIQAPLIEDHLGRVRVAPQPGPVSRSPRNPSPMPGPTDARAAVTHYRVLHAGEHYSLIQVRLETGRKHQVRVHMQSRNCPLAGDDRYGAQSDPLGRLALHAAELGFTHPDSGESLRFTSPAPPRFYTICGSPAPRPHPPDPTSSQSFSSPLPPDSSQPAPVPSHPESFSPAFAPASSQEHPAESLAGPPPPVPIPRALAAELPEPQPEPSAPASVAPTGPDTSWESVAAWYDSLLDDRGSDHYRGVILPGAMRLLRPARGQRILDVACGQGVLSRLLAEAGAIVTGVDVSASLIERARARSAAPPDARTASRSRAARRTPDPAGARPEPTFVVGDARSLDSLGLTGFDAAACIMALSNIDPISPVVRGVSAALRPGGVFVFIIVHPAFRAAGQTAWGWDGASGRQYRRVDGYLSPGATPIRMHPGANPTLVTWTFHRPMQTYVRTLAEHQLLIDTLEEWPAQRVSTSGPRAVEENRARREIPLFLGVRAVKAG